MIFIIWINDNYKQGSCNGGNPIDVYAFGNTDGLPEETCQNYDARNPDEFTCSGTIYKYFNIILKIIQFPPFIV